jgi:predicted naringenin-chalcone synthase
VQEIKIASIGTAVPPHKIPQELHYSIIESANGMSRAEKLQVRKVYSGTGIKYRHSVLAEFGREDSEENILFHPANHHLSLPVSKRMALFEEHASNLAESAAKDCFLKVPDIDFKSITHLITFSCTGMSAPGLDIQLIERLGLQRNVERTCINFMGCYAGINALRSAYHICSSQPEAVVMVVGVELCTIHYQKHRSDDQLIANALFADGAAACIVTQQKLNSTDDFQFSLKHFYSEYAPAGMEEMVWRIGDFGFDLRLSVEVPNHIRQNVATLMQKLFHKAGIIQDDISYYAIHPGGKKILEACEQALELTKEQNEVSYKVLGEYGNMSSVTVFFVLQECMKKFIIHDKGKKVLSCAFGPGLTMESMILEIC